MTKTIYVCDCCGMEVSLEHLHKCYKEIRDWTGYKNIVKTWELCENGIDRLEAAMEAEAAKLKGMCVPLQGAYSNGGGE